MLLYLTNLRTAILNLRNAGLSKQFNLINQKEWYCIAEWLKNYWVLVTAVELPCTLASISSRYFSPTMPKEIKINRAEKIAARSNIVLKTVLLIKINLLNCQHNLTVCH